MTDAMIAELARKNRDLSQVVTRLSTIVLRNAVEQRQLAARQADLPLSPVERIAKLRELTMQSGELREISLRLMSIGLACREPRVGNMLKGLAGEFSDEAGRVDGLITATRVVE
jgi:hypothetical protein